MNPYLIIAALVGSIGLGFGGFLYGEHVRGTADLAAEQTAVIASYQKGADEAKAQAAAERPIASTFDQQKATDETAQPAVSAAIASLVSGSLRNCPASNSGAVPPVPAIRSKPIDKAATVAIVASRSSAPQVPSTIAIVGSQSTDAGTLAADIAHDASMYPACVDQLNALISTAIAAGADKP